MHFKGLDPSQLEPSRRAPRILAWPGRTPIDCHRYLGPGPPEEALSSTAASAGQRPLARASRASLAGSADS